MSNDEIAIEGFVTFVEPGDLKTVCQKIPIPKIPAFAIVGILNAQVWFSGEMPGVERGCKISIRGKLDGWIVKVVEYKFVDPTAIQQCVMDTLAGGGRVHYLDDSSIFTSGPPVPTKFSKLEESAMFRILKSQNTRKT